MTEISEPKLEVVPEPEIATAEVTSEEAASILQTIDESPSFEEMMTSVEPIVNAAEPGISDTVATETMPKSEYVESVAKELSKERKGGLSELFDKKRKVLFGISALVVASVGVVGSLYGFGVLDGSKANVTESKPVEVAMVKKPAPKPPVETPPAPKPKDDAMAELPAPIVPEKVTASGATASGITVAHTGSVVTSVPVTATGTVVGTASGATTATGTGKTVSAPTTATGATVKPATPVDSNVNTLRTPNVRKKRGE